MNKDQLAGKAVKVKGRAEEVAGIATGHKSTEVKGAVDRAKGALREKVGDVKKAVARALASDGK